MIGLQNSGNLIEFLQTVPERAIPDKVTHAYLESIGYKSKNDRPIISVCKALGIFDVKGAPTEAFRYFRTIEGGKTVLPKLIKEAYAALYSVYPTAHEVEDQKLKDVIARNTDAGQATQRNILQTFKALSAYAEWGNAVSLDAAKTPSVAEAISSYNTFQTKAVTRSGKTLPQRHLLTIDLKIDGSMTGENLASILIELSKYNIVTEKKGE